MIMTLKRWRSSGTAQHWRCQISSRTSKPCESFPFLRKRYYPLLSSILNRIVVRAPSAGGLISSQLDSTPFTTSSTTGRQSPALGASLMPTVNMAGLSTFATTAFNFTFKDLDRTMKVLVICASVRTVMVSHFNILEWYVHCPIQPFSSSKSKY